MGYAAEYLTRGKFATQRMGRFPLMSICCILYHFPLYQFYTFYTAIIFSFRVFRGSNLCVLCVLCGYSYVAVDRAVHRRERRAVVRRRPEVADKPCRDFQTFGVIKGQCPGIIFLFVFHPKRSKSLCHFLQPSSTSTSARSFALPDAFLLAIKSSREIIRTGMPSIVFGTALVTATAYYTISGMSAAFSSHHRGNSAPL